uniref:RAP domain-containing protein n=1 Tax=Rhodnius prolixus TaxID=13249 RepID=T1I4Z2_RHOPR
MKKHFQYSVLTKFNTCKKFLTWDFQKTSYTADVLEMKKMQHLNCEDIANIMWTSKKRGTLSKKLIFQVDVAVGKKLSIGIVHENDVLPLLQCFASVMPSHVVKTVTYKNAISFLLKNPPSLLYHKLQAMYYASLAKKKVASRKLVGMLMKKISLEELLELSTTELGILCISLFQSSIPIRDINVLRYFSEKIKTDLLHLIKYESYIFVSFIKCFRYSRYYDDLFLYITEIPDELIIQMPLISKIHLAVYFSDARYSDIVFVNKLIKMSLWEINDKLKGCESVRLKDIDNILWCAKQFSLSEITEEINKSLIPKYIFHSANESTKDNLILILNSFLSLWILDCKKEEIISYLTNKNLSVTDVSGNFKDEARISLLLSCCNIEGEKFLDGKPYFAISKKQEPSISQQLVVRPKFAKVLQYLLCNGHLFDLHNIQFSYPVPCLYIASVTALYNGVLISVEVIDEFVCLRNSQHLHGNMKLKLRLLEKLKIPTFMVNLSGQKATNDVLNGIFEELSHNFAEIDSSSSSSK